jgi:hypothetical protein
MMNPAIVGWPGSLLLLAVFLRLFAEQAQGHRKPVLRPDVTLGLVLEFAVFKILGEKECGQILMHSGRLLGHSSVL